MFCARLSLIQLHRGRKGRYILGSNDAIPFGPSILSSIVRVLRFKDTVNTARTTLQILGNALTQAGLATAVVSRMVGMDDKDLELLQGILTGSEASDQLGGSVSLQIQGWRVISLLQRRS